MSVSDNDFNLDLHFLPAWAQQSPDLKKFARHAEMEDRRRDREPGDGRSRPGGQGGFRDRGPSRGGPPGGSRRDDNRGGPRRKPDGARDSRGGGDRRDFRGPPPPREAPIALPEVEVVLMPDEKGVDSISRQIKLTGRAYPLFEIAQMILQKPERQQVKLSVMRKPDGQVSQPLFVCALDDTIWLSEEEAVQHILSKHFDTFYQTEKTATEPPKGTYTFVAQCGMSGAILGPPNYHDYQNQLRKLHAERFARVPFEAFKARVKIVKDEEVVKKWIEGQSWKNEYACLNVPEPKKLGSREEVEAHFRETHKANLIKSVDTHSIPGAQVRAQPSPMLQRLIRREWEEQKRFPLKVVNHLSQQFASRGLQFFKVNKSVTHVAVARPHYLDLETTPVSDRVRKIVEFINAHPRCRHRQLLEALAPSAPAAAIPAPEGGTPAKAAESPELTPQQTEVIADLHWLVHEGHVIEFASGTMETAKKPLPRPVKTVKPPPAAAVEKPTTGTEVQAPATHEETPAAEGTTEESLEVSTEVSAEATDVATEANAETEESKPAV